MSSRIGDAGPRCARSICEKRSYFRLIYFTIGISIGIILFQIQEQHTSHIKAFQSDEAYRIDEQEQDINETSTETAMLSALNHWTSTLDDKKPLDVVYFDFAKAFDKVSHELLLLKLAKIGIHEQIISWLKCFLTERTFQVCINDTLSSIRRISSGVPQGGVLSPILFNIYTCELPDIIAEEGVGCIAYADDLKIYNPIVTPSDNMCLQKAIDAVATWASEWKLPLSKQKTKVLHIGRNNPKLKYNLCSEFVSETSEIVDLGYIIDENLSFDKYCKEITAKATRQIYCLFKALRTKNVAIMIKAYKTYVRPIMEYGTTIFNPHKKSLINMIEKVQNNFTRKLMVRTVDLVKVAKVIESKVRIFCWVLTGKQNHERRAQHIKETWVRRCNKYLFMSSEENSTLPAHNLNVSEGRKFLWMKTREAFKYIHDKYLNDFDWFLKADDDTYVIVENLRYLLLPYSSKDALHFGFKFRPYTKRGYHSGGAGYILSREALRRFVNKAYSNDKICQVKGISVEDVAIGRCLERIGVRAGDTRDQEGLHRFSPLSPDSMISGPYPKWMLKMTYYNIPTSSWCCSRYAVSFHYVSPTLLYMMEYLIYRVKVFGLARNLRLDEDEAIFKAAHESALAAKGPDRI
ncbi:hypothetical protein Y032_0003g1495 [Ancylostoma ceylanicum]|uniref:Glycoprotein-N-acetylgalactosamine 3-beta-galactosyltransferase 1 n=1 Tax=Ancylostoma ceylanicum TaxID=53326 RepID=A0A016VXF1_9BILA|nr:hypothetical protein Y032_0003g1495 [Ancylostoma ceylanicum]